MKRFNSPVSFKTYAAVMVSVLVIGGLLAIVGELYFGSLAGGLTRIGALPERDFGWQESQPEVEEGELRSFPLNEADIVIVGDSFSVSLVWQSRLVRAGFKLGTLHWKDVRLCSDDFVQALKRAGFPGRYVIIESVERAFQNRMRAPCSKGSKILKGTEYSLKPPQTSPPGFAFSNERLGAAWVLESIYNVFSYKYAPRMFMKFGDARMIATDDGCKKFSNRLCQYGLYYSADFGKESFASIENVLRIGQNISSAGIRPIWLVVPDKSTVYLGPEKYNSKPYVNIWKTFNEHGVNAIQDLDDRFILQSSKTRDFYAPNDTHLSTAGYLYLGELMLGYIRSLER